jgi:hypothetical protein
MLTSTRIAAAALCLLGASCATGTKRVSGSATDLDGAFANTVVTAEELARSSGTGSLREALELVRPTMLVVRGVPPMVSVDGAALTDLSVLRSITTSRVREVRLVRASPTADYVRASKREYIAAGAVIQVWTWRR